eukprot:CAMPEP_0174695012 /NCGR_PEP_ID=MMETSP1094-20130205/1478_1 /TAXON_ID=156173 /ORGANISM="Chrysochromulina brevifilum, Strain UTEX LB 985" /LENGTH=78 /DNA_ID=CAMNT_0015891399 /DNA_START=365 /DNA_END=599 /DNA_ORIENTATION=+
MKGQAPRPPPALRHCALNMRPRDLCHTKIKEVLRTAATASSQSVNPDSRALFLIGDGMPITAAGSGGALSALEDLEPW